MAMQGDFPAGNIFTQVPTKAWQSANAENSALKSELAQLQIETLELALAADFVRRAKTNADIDHALMAINQALAQPTIAKIQEQKHG